MWAPCIKTLLLVLLLLLLLLLLFIPVQHLNIIEAESIKGDLQTVVFKEASGGLVLNELATKYRLGDY